MKPDLYNWISTVAADHGVEAAAEVAAFEAKHVQAVKDIVEKEEIDCDYAVTRAVDVQLSGEHFQKLKAGRERLIASGCAPTRQALCVGPEQAEEVTLN